MFSVCLADFASLLVCLVQFSWLSPALLLSYASVIFMLCFSFAACFGSSYFIRALNLPQLWLCKHQKEYQASITNISDFFMILSHEINRKKSVERVISFSNIHILNTAITRLFVWKNALYYVVLQNFLMNLSDFSDQYY